MQAKTEPQEKERARERERVLDPISRISEILFGLIMALTFTSTISAATAGHDEVHTLMYAAIGCNVAWGLVDAVMYLVAALTERGRGLVLARGIRAAPTADQAHELIGSALPPLMASMMTSADYEHLRQRVLELPHLADRPTLNKEDWRGALAVFVLVVLSTFPVVIPFLLFRSVHVAMRTSNAIAIALLFAAGYLLAHHGGYSPWRTGLSMVVLGVLLVALTIALGG
jgi:VIT1/CCC1 family predicted Fe2+/Mn2+ transporter